MSPTDRRDLALQVASAGRHVLDRYDHSRPADLRAVLDRPPAAQGQRAPVRT